MNANDVIECYITDVAAQLPRRQRNDVAFELRALLGEELQARADASGRAADAAMATELLQAFGRPADVAARYRPALTIVDPADGRAFVQWTVIGLAIIWCLGLLQVLPSVRSGSDLLRAAGQWWGTAVLPSLWWPGMLVAGFGLAAWRRRQWPATAKWTPRADGRGQGSRAALALAVAGIACGLALLFEPHRVLDIVWAGRAAPAAYEALTYTEAFRRLQAPVLFALVASNIPLLLAVIARGGWSPALRRLETALGLATCAAMVWAVASGPLLMTPAGDRTARVLMLLIAAFSLLHFASRAYRGVRPAPDRLPQR